MRRLLALLITSTACLIAPTGASAASSITIFPSTINAPTPVAEYHGATWFVGGDGRLRGLYRTDGTPAGTHLMVKVPGREYRIPGSAGLAVFGDRLVFTATSSYWGTGYLMTSDGTPAGTRRVLKVQQGIRPGRTRLSVSAPTVTATQLYVSASANSNAETSTLSRVDLTKGTLTPVLGKDIDASPIAADAAGGLYFSTGDLWHASPDGVPVRLAGATSREAYGGAQYGALGDQLWFVGSDPAHGSEPWVTDGTPAGTHMVADIQPGTASTDISAFGAAGSSMYAMAGPPGGPGENPRTAYLLTGPSAPALLTYDGGPIQSDRPRMFVDTGDALWFRTTVGTDAQRVRVPAGASVAEPSPGPVADENGALIVPGERFYLSGLTQLRSADAAGASTTLATTGASYSKASQEVSINAFTVIGDVAWFLAPAVDGGPWVRWRSDGTVAGTHPVVTPGQIDPVGSLLAASVAVHHDRRAPYRWKLTGTVTPSGNLPSTGAQLCDGTVSVTTTRYGGFKPLHRQHVPVHWNGSACIFRETITPPAAVLRAGDGKLGLSIQFDGTDHVVPWRHVVRVGLQYG